MEQKVCLRQTNGTGHLVAVSLESKTDSAVQPTRIIGSSYGWVVTVDEACPLTLLEPLTGGRFPLPPITSSLERSKQGAAAT
nr:putative F-box protein [Triticum aestivum]